MPVIPHLFMVDGGGDLSEEMVLVQARPPASCLLLGLLSSCPVPARDLATQKVVRRLRGGEYMAAWTQDLKLKDRLRPGGPEEARAGGLSGGDGLGLFGLFIQIWKVFFFCLHLSHAGHGPRDLLCRYSEQDCASPAGPTHSPSWLSRHLPNLLRPGTSLSAQGAIH